MLLVHIVAHLSHNFLEILNLRLPSAASFLGQSTYHPLRVSCWKPNSTIEDYSSLVYRACQITSHTLIFNSQQSLLGTHYYHQFDFIVSLVVLMRCFLEPCRVSSIVVCDLSNWFGLGAKHGVIYQIIWPMMGARVRRFPRHSWFEFRLQKFGMVICPSLREFSGYTRVTRHW